ncbi:MAG TPA: hydroxyphenylacetyl-CoA thioesterase PaaI [Albitalea sp.]
MKEMPDTRSAQHTAEHVRERMFASDRASRTLGIAVESIAPGHATLTMTVREPMLNGHDICHGGFIATLADSAFAYACNAGNQMTVASGFAIDFIAAARLGDVLTAHCSEVAKKGRSGVYDTLVSNQHGECIALFRGRSHTIQGKPAVAD